MDMDWGTALIGLIVILITLLPFVVMYYNRVKMVNKMLHALNENARHHNCKINQHELCGDFILGIDENSKFVFFFKQKKEEDISLFVDLTKIQSCMVGTKTKHLKNDSGSHSKVEQVELSFVPTQNGKEATKFELYDVEKNYQLSGELQIADKWSKLINVHIKGTP